MKKYIVILIILIAVVTTLFNVVNYDFVEQMEKISNVTFVNPFDSVQDFIDIVDNLVITTDEGFDIFSAFSSFFTMVRDMLLLPVNILKDLALDLVYVLKIVFYLFGME